MEGKKFYLSKTFWTAVVIGIAGVVASITGVEIATGTTTSIVAVIMMILRMVTKEPIVI